LEKQSRTKEKTDKRTKNDKRYKNIQGQIKEIVIIQSAKEKEEKETA